MVKQKWLQRWGSVLLLALAAAFVVRFGPLSATATGRAAGLQSSPVKIHDIQGGGATSPLVGQTVVTRGVVTGRKSNGFFLQEPDVGADADPATSEGIFVFTSSAPPADAAIGNSVEVTGKVSEFVPSSDPLQPPLTELTAPSVTLLGTGNPLPAPVLLGASLPDAAGAFDQLERLEGMRVRVDSLTVVGPTLGNISEANATATTTGVFYGVVTGVARPFREPGIQAPDPAPAGSIPPIPRFDGNPEVLRVDSRALGGSAIDVGTGAVVTNLVGPLDYAQRRYTILPDAATPPTVTGGPTPTVVSPQADAEITIASFNLQRFYDTTNDPSVSDVVLTAAAFERRLAKASLAIRNSLRAPDILGVVEMENLPTLESLAARISADAVAAGQSDPRYAAYLVEGNDVGGIDVGFLVKTAPVNGSVPRVTVVSVTQEGKAATYLDPRDNTPQTLNDRPPLVLAAQVNHANGESFAVTVIANHLRSLNGVDSAVIEGMATRGERVRRKRQAQAEFLANLVQARQAANPNERIVVVGDFNAFEFNDGFADVIGTIRGRPSPNEETAVTGDGADLVEPDLVNLADTAPARARYSYVFDGNAQSLDHVLVNRALVNATSECRLEHPRINADFPETARNDGTSAVRISDHDPVVAYFRAFGVGRPTKRLPRPAHSEKQRHSHGAVRTSAEPDGLRHTRCRCSLNYLKVICARRSNERINL